MNLDSIVPDAARSDAGEAIRLRIATFNVQDRLLADCRRLRMVQVGRALGELEPHVVGFQEAFSPAHRKILLSALEESAGRRFHEIYFRSGPYGSGLLIVSVFPLERRGFLRFSRNGSWRHLRRGDFYAGKGIAWVRAEVSPSAWIDVFNTHTISGYHYCADDYFDDRQSQMRELRRFIDESRAEPTRAGFLVGDLNCFPGDLEYRTAVGDGDASIFQPLLGMVSIDHVFGLAAPEVGYSTVETRALTTVVLADGRQIRLSDHVGWCVTVDLRLSGRGA